MLNQSTQKPDMLNKKKAIHQEYNDILSRLCLQKLRLQPRGLSSRVVHFGHALKNTLVPVITITGLQIGSIIAFAIITERVFQWPGMGLMFLQSIQNVDIPIMAAYLILIAFFFVAINLVVDLLYYLVDPRLRIDSSIAHGI